MKYHSPLCFPSHNIKKNTETHPPPTREVIIEQPLICHVVPPFECSEGIVSVPMLVLLCISQQLYSFRSSHQRFSVKKCVLRSFAKFTGVFLSILPIFQEHLFLQKKSGLLFLQFYLSLSLRNIVFSVTSIITLSVKLSQMTWAYVTSFVLYQPVCFFCMYLR